MSENGIELTVEEKVLLAKIDFNSSSSVRQEHGNWKAVSDAALELMKSLLARRAIPEVRGRYFSDPDFNIGGRGRSRVGIFEKNGTQGEAIFRHPHFIKYLHYFLYGPDLPAHVMEPFRQKIGDIGLVTSSDIVPLGAFARQLTRANKLFSPVDQLYGLAAAARQLQAEELKQLHLVFVAPVADVVVNKLREMKQRVTRDTYAELAYWRPYRTLSAEQKADVREAVYAANIQ